MFPTEPRGIDDITRSWDILRVIGDVVSLRVGLRDWSMRSDEHSSAGAPAKVDDAVGARVVCSLCDWGRSAAIFGFLLAFCSHISRVLGSIGHAEGSCAGRGVDGVDGVEVGVCAGEGASYGGGSAFHQPILRSMCLNQILNAIAWEKVSSEFVDVFVDVFDVNDLKSSSLVVAENISSGPSLLTYFHRFNAVLIMPFCTSLVLSRSKHNSE